MLLSLALAAADPSSARLPRAIPIPYVAPASAPVTAPVTALLSAFLAGDSAGVLSQVYPDGRVTATGVRSTSSGLRSEDWRAFAARVGPGFHFDERISDPAIEIDGDVAMVWAPYTVRIDGKIANCGFDHFDLVRDGAGWKVMNLTFSSRITGCGD